AGKESEAAESEAGLKGIISNSDILNNVESSIPISDTEQAPPHSPEHTPSPEPLATIIPLISTKSPSPTSSSEPSTNFDKTAEIENNLFKSTQELGQLQERKMNVQDSLSLLTQTYLNLTQPQPPIPNNLKAMSSEVFESEKEAEKKKQKDLEAQLNDMAANQAAMASKQRVMEETLGNVVAQQ
ncbi:hypothetical protein A2U01_0009420, partial [Trifolium medium]|nr:hypothetical protein [Trifolium medium]